MRTTVPRLNLIQDEVNQKLFGCVHQPPTDAELKHLKDFQIEDNSVWNSKDLLELPDNLKYIKDAALQQWQPYQKLIDDFLTNPIPASPTVIPKFADHWAEWVNGFWIPIEVDSLPALMVFDVETVNFSGTWNAVCGSGLGMRDGQMSWFAYRVGYRRHPIKELIPFSDNCLIIGHNVSYDLSFLVSSYSLNPTNLVSLCTMSMAKMIYGVSNQQQALYKAFKQQLEIGKGVPRWVHEASESSLSAVHEKLFSVGLDKSVRGDLIVDLDWSEWNEHIEKILLYNFEDVAATARVFGALYPQCRVIAPSDITWVGMLHLSTQILRLDDDWHEFIIKCDNAYQKLMQELCDRLKNMAQDYYQEWYKANILGFPPDDGLDWTLNKSGKYKGLPKWWTAVCREGITVKSRIAPVVAKLKFHSHPLRWCKKSSREGTWAGYSDNGLCNPIPHPNSTDISANVSSPFMEDLIPLMEQGVLTSDRPDFNLVSFTEQFVSLINWTMMRQRVQAVQAVNTKEWGNLVKPLAVIAGTQTRRCVDKLWLVAPTAKEERLGTELLGYIQAPDGYKLIGADWDAQESVIQSWLADSYPAWKGLIERPFPGYNEFSLAVLAGDKDKETDIHSLNAKKAQIKRKIAKNLGFALAYGGGVKKLAAIVKVANPKISLEDATSMAQSFVDSVKGKKNCGYYSGGSASHLYNATKKLIEQPHMRTSVLKVQCPRPIDPYYTQNDFVTTKGNFHVQSVGVDLLHLLLTTLHQLFKQYGVSARLACCIHDWQGFWVKDEQVETAKKCFQTAHLLVKAFAMREMGFDTMPLSGCLFSSVDVDTRLRKPGDKMITPSNPNGFID